MAHYPYDIFRERLAIRYPASGHALWNPSPSRGYKRAVEVGDVGFIREGQFHRLFNALLPGDDPSHDLGVPEHHEVLKPSVSNHINPSVLCRHHYCSTGVTMTENEGNYGASNPDDCKEVSLTCKTREGGAVLSIPVQAQCRNTLSREDFKKWMIKHIDRWFAFSRKLGLGIKRMEEIVFVTGCDCTRSWTNVAFLEGQEDAHASFLSRVVVDKNDGSTSINWHFSPERIRGALLNQGPEGKNQPQNGCIFVRGFRAMRRLRFLPAELKAAGAPSDPDESNSDPDIDTEIISFPPTTKYRDPLHLLLDHVAEIEQRALDCDMALVHDDDLATFFGICAGTEDLQLDIALEFFNRHHGIFEPSPSKSNSSVGAEIVKVAIPLEAPNNRDSAPQSSHSSLASRSSDATAESSVVNDDHVSSQFESFDIRDQPLPMHPDDSDELVQVMSTTPTEGQPTLFPQPRLGPLLSSGNWTGTSQVHQDDSHPSLIETSTSRSQVPQRYAPKHPYRVQWQCPSCGKLFQRRQECFRHLLEAHLPYSIYCPSPGCSWMGDRQYSLESHWDRQHPHEGQVPEPRQAQIYDPNPLLKSIMDGTLTVEKASELAYSRVEEKATEPGKKDLWEKGSRGR